MQRYVAWKKGLTAEERDQIKRYTVGSSTHVNGFLREDKSDPDYAPDSRANIEYARRTALINSALDDSPEPPQDLVVWRGIHPDAVKGAQTGDIIQLDGFQSGSIDPWLAQRWEKTSTTVLEIVPRAGAYIEALSGHKGEYEFLMPSGRKYRVVGTKEIVIKKSWRSGSTPGASTADLRRAVLQLEMLP